MGRRPRRAGQGETSLDERVHRKPGTREEILATRRGGAELLTKYEPSMRAAYAANMSSLRCAGAWPRSRSVKRSPPGEQSDRPVPPEMIA